jgi:hypothetical protein
MPLPLPAAKTYADLLQTLRVRCGLHATIGATPALEDILTGANEYVFNELDNGLPWKSTLSLLADTREYPFITDEGLPIARGSVHTVWIEQGDSIRVPLSQGINHGMRANVDLRGIPEAYDTSMTDDGFTLEVWPTPDQAFTLYVDHNRVLSRFSEPTDKPSAPSRLVLDYAIAMGKAHYGKPDADVVGQAFAKAMAGEKARQRENRRFIPPSSERRGPQVVRTATGYRQV